MNELSRWAILFGLALVATQASATEPGTIKLEGCGTITTCVPMLLDVDSGAERSVILSPRDTDAAEDAEGFTVFQLRFEGRLKGKIQTVDAAFQGYTEGIHCTAFGQGTVGFLGYSDAGNPIINSSAGPIEVTDSRIEVGCDKCFIISDPKTGKTIATFRSPGYDLLLVGHKPLDFFYDLPAGYNIKTKTMCLRVQDKGPVQSVYPERCEATKTMKLDFKEESCS